MEIAVSGLANLGPAPPATPSAADNSHQQELVLPPIHNSPSVVTPPVTDKKKEKGGLFKRLVKLGSNRQVADRADNSVNNSTKKSDVPSWVNDGGIPPTPNFASKPRLPPKGTPGNHSSSKKFENPSNVFVPPTMDESAKTQTKKASNDNKDKPPKYIVIGAKKPSSSNLSMPDHSQAGATLDESYSTVNHIDSNRHLRVRRLDEEEDDDDDDARTKEEDIAYCQASVSETSSVSSASLQDALEWKIFGGGSGAAKNKDTKKEEDKKKSTRTSLKKPPPAASPALDVVLDDEPPKAKRASEKEIALVLANEAMERRASMVNPEEGGGGGKKKFQSTCFNPHATANDEANDDEEQDEVSTLHTTGPSILSAPLNVPDSKEAAAHVQEEAKEAIKEDMNYMYSPVAAAASLPKQLRQEEEDAMLARKLQNEETEQEDQDALFASKLQQEEEEEHFRKSMSRRHVMQDDSRATAYERQRSSRRMMGGGMHHDHSDPGYYPGDRRHSHQPHHHHHHGMDRSAPRTPEHGHSGGRPPNSTGRRSSQGPPPTSRRNWIQRNEDYSFASSPTVLEPNRRQNPPISSSRHSHTKDRQRQLQRMNEEGQQWFSHDGDAPPRGHHGMSQSDRDHHHHHHHHRGGPPSTRRDRGSGHDHRGVDYGHRGHHPMHHHHRGGGSGTPGSGRMSSNNSVRSDPNLFMSGSSEDDYDSMRGGPHGGGGRPRSPTSQRDLVQIYPGVYVPLRSATETEQAIAGDYYIHSQCIGCNTDIFCILDAAYVICPLCKFICPLDEMGGPHRHGLGIGFTGKTLCEMKTRVRMGGSSVSGSSSHSNLLAHLR